MTPEQAAAAPVEVVLQQRPRDVPAVYLEHSTPPHPTDARHPAACRPDLTLVHVTHFNRLFWDTAGAMATLDHID